MTATHSRDAVEPRSSEDDAGAPSRHKTKRYATVVLEPGPRGFYSICAGCIDDAEITCERIHHINLLDDGTIVGLYQLRGERERMREALDDNPQVLSYDIVGTDEVLLYLHEEATDLARGLLSILDEREVILETPHQFATDGSLRVTLLGIGASLQQAIADIDDEIGVQLEETGRYRPDMRDTASMLTARQHEILQIAVENGYYESPRRATYRDIATEVGLSHATVAEHIQKIEATMLPQIVHP